MENLKKVQPVKKKKIGGYQGGAWWDIRLMVFKDTNLLGAVNKS